MSNSEIIYLDHAAATPLDENVLAAMQPYFADDFYNPSSPYAPAVLVKNAMEDARHRLAISLGVRPTEIVITAGATESINLALRVAADGHMVTTSIEHDAVLKAAQAYDNTVVAVDQRGVVDPAAIKSAITDRTRLVSVGLANHEIGTIQKLRDIASVVHEVRVERQNHGDKTPLWLHSDASQGVGQIDVNVARLGVDMLTLNASKIYGPKQVGLLYAAPGVDLKPLVYGGGQERGLRSGTENVAGIIGFATALEMAERKRKSEAHRLGELRDYLERQLIDNFDDMVISGHQKRRLPGHLHVSFPNLDAERLVFLLEARGVLVATGSACSANQNTRSHVLEAIGLAPEVADGSLRLTLGRLSNQENIKRAADIIVEVIKGEKTRVGQHA